MMVTMRATGGGSRSRSAPAQPRAAAPLRSAPLRAASSVRPRAPPRCALRHCSPAAAGSGCGAAQRPARTCGKGKTSGTVSRPAG